MKRSRDRESSMSRREMLGLSASWTLAAALGVGRAARGGLAAGPWARVEGLGDGVWAVVSTPLVGEARRTACNGGVLVGRDRVLVIEASASG